jgi:hypothetical protein
LSGCIALLMHATGIRDSATLLQKLTNYAKPIMAIIDEKQGSYLESPIEQRSGLVQVHNNVVSNEIMSNHNNNICRILSSEI